MDDILKTAIQSEGFTGGFFTFLGIVITAIIAPIINEKIKAKKGEENPYAHPSLKKHHIFSRISILRNYITIKFHMNNKGKELVFKDLLLNYLNIWECNLRELAEEIDSMDADTGEPLQNGLQSLIMRNFNKSVSEFSTYYVNTNYTADEQKCLSVVIEKFNSWNYYRTDTLCNSLMYICTCEFYPTKEIRSCVIFDAYINLFLDMVGDAEQTMSHLNGDLRGLIFRGVEL